MITVLLDKDSLRFAISVVSDHLCCYYPVRHFMFMIICNFLEQPLVIIIMQLQLIACSAYCFAFTLRFKFSNKSFFNFSNVCFLLFHLFNIVLLLPLLTAFYRRFQKPFDLNNLYKNILFQPMFFPE